MHPIASRFTPPARPTPYTLHAHHRRAFAGPNSWPRHHSSFPDSAHLPGTANAAPRLSRPPSHTFLAIVLALVPLLQTSKMHHDDREMSALGPGTDQLVTIPIPLRQRRSVGCFTYPHPMPSDAWLGVHVGLDLGNRCRFGPDLHWVDTLDYDVDASRIDSFYASIRRYYPALRDGALQPDYTGIRPKDLRPRRGRSRLRHPGTGDAWHRRPGESLRDRVPRPHVVARHRRGGRRTRHPDT